MAHTICFVAERADLQDLSTIRSGGAASLGRPFRGFIVLNKGLTLEPEIHTEKEDLGECAVV
jgi:hypothetical protein